MIDTINGQLPTLSQYLSYRPSEYVSLVQVDEEDFRVSKEFTSLEILNLLEADPTKEALREAILSPFGILPEDLRKFNQIFGMVVPSTKVYTNDLNALADGIDVNYIYKPYYSVLGPDDIKAYLINQVLSEILLSNNSSWGLNIIELREGYNVPKRLTYETPLLARRVFYKLLLTASIEVLTEVTPSLRILNPSLAEIHHYKAFVDINIIYK